MATLCLADLDLEPCNKQHEPKGNTQSMLQLIEVLKAKPTEQGASLGMSTGGKASRIV